MIRSALVLTIAATLALAARQVPPGMVRTVLIDNGTVLVTRLGYPNDLITVQATAGRLEILRASEKTTGERAAGTVEFVPRDVHHAYASVDTKPFELLSVAIK